MLGAGGGVHNLGSCGLILPATTIVSSIGYVDSGTIVAATANIENNILKPSKMNVGVQNFTYTLIGYTY